MSDDLPLMPKATAVWLVDNTTLTFRQIADFCGMHELEISGIADGEVAIGIKGFDPIVNHQLTAEDIQRCEGDPIGRLKLLKREKAPPPKRKVPRYTPVSKRQDRPAAIAWLVRYHPEMENNAIAKLVGSTKPTIESIRNRSHWNIANIQPVDPVALGLCRQIDLDAAVQKAADKKAATTAPSVEESMRLMSTAESLAAAPEPEPSPFGLEDPRGDEPETDTPPDFNPDDLFNLPKGGGSDDEPT
ncbi:MAG: cell cycle transcriptional regulator TrcR [Pseudomonadota bacterium]